MKKSNKQLGTAFERELAKILSDNGFWVHLLRQTEAGQPADMIAVKNCCAFLIDCKVCSNDVFPLSRIEQNQRYAMLKWDKCNETNSLFALKMSDGSIYFLSLDLLSSPKDSVADKEFIETNGIPLDEFFLKAGVK